MLFDAALALRFSVSFARQVVLVTLVLNLVMARTRSMTIYERIVNIEGLPDELREKVLSNLTINELLAFQCVSKRWQRNVSGVINDVKVLAVSMRDQSSSYSDFICGHCSSQSSTLACHFEDEARVCQLITKMHNLIAVGLPVRMRPEVLIAALVNCSKLEHIAFSPRPTFSTDTKTLRTFGPQLTCLSPHTRISHETINEMVSLKHFHYNQHPLIRIPFEHVRTLLNSGLIELETPLDFDHMDAVCKLGSRLESFNANFYRGEDNRATLRANHVLQIVQSMPHLKKLKVNLEMKSLVLLKDLKHLEDLTIYTVSLQEAHLFKEAMAPFGQRIKTLCINNLGTNNVMADLATVCPNLESFAVVHSYDNSHESRVLIAELPKLTKLRFLNYKFVHWKIKEIVKLLDGLPNLRSAECMVVNVELIKFKTLVKQMFPQLDFQINNCW